MAEPDYEETLLMLPECFVYKIPPRTSAGGYKAADWNIQNFIWTGRLVIKAKGDQCEIRLLDAKGDIFAVCPINTTGPQAVEAVTDSSRYFVLRIEDGKGHHAFIGMGFTERTSAFDFNVALQEHAKSVQRRKELAEAKDRLAKEPAKDYSLKEGETIKVNIKTNKHSRPKPSGVEMGTGLLAPPPGGKARTKKPASSQELGPNDWTEFSSGQTSAPQGGTANTTPQGWVPFS